MEQLSDNRKKIREAFRSKQINAICGYPGIGKTYLTHKYPQFVDGFFSKQYYLDKKNGIVNPDFLDNYRRFCFETVLFGKIVVCAMHPNERERYFNIYDTRPDEREWIELNKSTWDTKIQSLKDAVIPTNCFKDEIPTGMNLTEYLEWLGIFEEVSNAEIRRYGWIVSGRDTTAQKNVKDEDKGRNRSAQAIMRTLR